MKLVFLTKDEQSDLNWMLSKFIEEADRRVVLSKLPEEQGGHSCPAANGWEAMSEEARRLRLKLC